MQPAQSVRLHLHLSTSNSLYNPWCLANKQLDSGDSGFYGDSVDNIVEENWTVVTVIFMETV